MLLYTTMPMEIVLENLEKEYEFKELDMGNSKLVIEQTGINTGRIVRLISSDPQDYLNPKFTPGNTISFNIK
ncbi:MAG TPA: hypothetical protein GX534_05030 [Thermoanaerobacterales bacterium]|nr:hypothetical protein [Thermoanaerobacterales bacterium]